MTATGFAIGKPKASVPGEGCGFTPNPKLKLLDQISEVMRFKHYSIRTETAYRDWIKRFIFFHGKRQPREMGAVEVARFLSDLAVTRKVASSTQNQAFNALQFLYREVLHEEWGELGRGSRVGDGRWHMASCSEISNWEFEISNGRLPGRVGGGTRSKLKKYGKWRQAEIPRR